MDLELHIFSYIKPDSPLVAGSSVVAAVVFTTGSAVAVTAWSAITFPTGTVTFTTRAAFAAGCAFALYVAFGFGLKGTH